MQDIYNNLPLINNQNHIWIYVIVTTYITILSVTLYLHRSATHGSVTFHPIVNHFMRMWLWLTTGMITHEWVAVHRYHHKYVEQPNDPHSPVQVGWVKVLFLGAFLYAKEKSKKEVLMEIKNDNTLPDDWLEKYIYASRYNMSGILIMLIVNIILFGKIGFIIWLIQMIWIPFWAAGIINGISHTFGYINHKDKIGEIISIGNSRNILPFGIIIGGEELHNNHHNNPGSAKFSEKWFEIDMGWIMINILKAFGLAKIKKNSK